MNIDVTEFIFPILYQIDNVQSKKPSITSIVLPNWTCNDMNYTIFDFSQFALVESIEWIESIENDQNRNQFIHSEKEFDWL